MAYVGPSRCSTTEWTDDAAVTCVTPAWGTGPTVNPVTVRVNGQTSAENVASAFQYGSRGSPVITALAWTRAPTEGGFTITLFGSKFEDNHAVAYVGRRDIRADVAISVANAQDNGNQAGGPRPSSSASPPMAPCRHTTWVSESKVECTAPAGVGTHLPVAVKTRDFPEAETFGSLFFDYDPPVVTGVSTSHGSIAGGMQLTVTGYGFGLADTQPMVKIGSSLCEKDGWLSDSSMLCTTPAGQGAAAVAVDVGGQWSSKPGQHAKDVPVFLYEGSSVTAISPAFAPASGGSVITLYGNDFSDAQGAGGPSSPLAADIISPPLPSAKASGAGGASRKGKAHACQKVAWVSSTAVTCTVPSGVGAGLDVEVRLGQQPPEVYRAFGLFSYAAPVVASVAPRVGNSAGGLPVTILGSNFGASDSDPTAYVGSTACSRTLYVSDDKVVCVTPPGGGPALPVSVSIANSHGAPLPAAFGYTPPSIDRVWPESGPFDGNTRLTIKGSNFGRSAAAAPQAFIGKLPCAHTTWLSNQMVVCHTPRGSLPEHRQLVTVKVQGIFTPALSSARFFYLRGHGARSGHTSSSRTRGGRVGGGLAATRAPGLYLSIAYLVAFAIILATVFILRLLLFRRSGVCVLSDCAKHCRCASLL